MKKHQSRREFCVKAVKASAGTATFFAMNSRAQANEAGSKFKNEVIFMSISAFQFENLADY